MDKETLDKLKELAQKAEKDWREGVEFQREANPTAVLGLIALAERTISPVSQTTDALLSLPIEELLGRYWQIAYSEGKTGESRGTEAQQVLSSILAAANRSQP